MPGTAPAQCAFQTAAEHAVLLDLERRAIRYFLDNQSPRTGLVLDRQRNFGAPRRGGLYSSAATGMGFIALALASAIPFRLLSRTEAARRVCLGLETLLENTPHTSGVLPHFLDSATCAVVGADARSTVDTAWLVAGALWAATFLGNRELHKLARKLFERIDWRAWTGPDDLIRHGADQRERPFPCCWDRLNGETVFMYVLAAGADEKMAWPASAWRQLDPFLGEAAGLRFGSADLGLFVFQYGLDLLDLRAWRLPDGYDLLGDAVLATKANASVCRAASGRFATYRRWWGLSAGDGPGNSRNLDAYRCYAPSEPLDGTAHVSATIPSVVHQPSLVWENLHQAKAERHFPLEGRYGFSNLNVDRGWVGQDIVGIDAGAIVLALDNCLFGDRVRCHFHAIEPVQIGLQRIGCTPVELPRLAAA
jgi:hypothetical protein